MSDAHDEPLILEMLDASARIAAYIREGGAAEFLRQSMVYDAVCMNLLRFGECARFLSTDLKARLPEVPWPDLVNLRNRLAHGYDTLKPDLLWRISSVNVPEVAAALPRPPADGSP